MTSLMMGHTQDLTLGWKPCVADDAAMVGRTSTTRRRDMALIRQIKYKTYKGKAVEKAYTEEASKTDWLVDIKVMTEVLIDETTIAHLILVETDYKVEAEQVREWFDDDGMRRIAVNWLDEHHWVVYTLSYI
jgi:ribosomal silencing factor RsfS